LVTIKTGGTGGTISIINTSDSNRATILTTVGANQTIIIDQKTGLVTATPSILSYYQKFNKIYLRLLSGSNTLAFTNTTATITELSFTYKKARVIF
jgi:hypothetical protein